MACLSRPARPCTTIDQVVRKRAETHANRVLISYPTTETAFVDYTGADLERLTALAARIYAQSFKLLGQDSGPGRRSSTVAIVGISSLEYYITFLALQRLGLRSMFLSPRLADQGFAHLLKSTRCELVVASTVSKQAMVRVRDSFTLPLAVIPMVDNECLTSPKFLNPKELALPRVDIEDSQEFIVHSSGTTGLPKPVPLCSKAWLLQAANIASCMPNTDTLTTLPLFHSFGLATLLHCLVNGRRLSLMNATRPITASVVLSSLDITASRTLVTVPYILRFISEAPNGVESLASLKKIIAAGSAVPDDLGNRLVDAGANIFHLYGQTESGALMEPSEDQWNWVTPLPHTEPYLHFEPVAENLCHLVVLPGLKAKALSNRPDGSYATKDLFLRHPTNPRKWKFVARQDDIIVLVNGEKADPIPLEEAVGRHPNVRTAVVFGAQRDSLGMIIVASDSAAALTKDEVVKSVMPNLEVGNSRVPAYARIPPDGIIVKGAGTPFPCTDKDTVIRSLFIQQFAPDIENYYTMREAAKNTNTLSDAEVGDIVRGAVRWQLKPGQDAAALTDESDFFVLGMDSLQATNVRSCILREVNLSGKPLATNVVFDHPSVTLLTNHLLDVRRGLSSGPESTEEFALSLLAKYSSFPQPVAGTAAAEKECIVSVPLSQPHPPLLPSPINRPDSSSPAQPAPSARTSCTPSSSAQPRTPSTASSAPLPPLPPTRASPPPCKPLTSSPPCAHITYPSLSRTRATSPTPRWVCARPRTPTSPPQPRMSSTTPGPSTSTTRCAPSARRRWRPSTR
ncbi:AMP-dependent synthetase/ligase [Macrophomina phaseolina MS6]|uniref:AMP-dependent synthetase/ligase n=1 Tax=Macrophomina phaseolina (strain MS6) TaxID=1126212 RepID=K2R9X6_MACPH|nr:AMP-dependent synthetase/ligase [Macrophomina phaseolina MS6]